MKEKLSPNIINAINKKAYSEAIDLAVDSGKGSILIQLSEVFVQLAVEQILEEKEGSAYLENAIQCMDNVSSESLLFENTKKCIDVIKSLKDEIPTLKKLQILVSYELKEINIQAFTPSIFKKAIKSKINPLICTTEATEFEQKKQEALQYAINVGDFAQENTPFGEILFTLTQILLDFSAACVRKNNTKLAFTWLEDSLQSLRKISSKNLYFCIAEQIIPLLEIAKRNPDYPGLILDCNHIAQTYKLPQNLVKTEKAMPLFLTDSYPNEAIVKIQRSIRSYLRYGMHCSIFGKCKLHLMLFFPNNDLESYKNSYILVEKQRKLIYVTFSGHSEDVLIADWKVFSEQLSKIRKDNSWAEELNLNSMEINTLITSNGGHTPSNLPKYEEKPIEILFQKTPKILDEDDEDFLFSSETLQEKDYDEKTDFYKRAIVLICKIANEQKIINADRLFHYTTLANLISTVKIGKLLGNGHLKDAGVGFTPNVLNENDIIKGDKNAICLAPANVDRDVFSTFGKVSTNKCRITLNLRKEEENWNPGKFNRFFKLSDLNVSYQSKVKINDRFTIEIVKKEGIRIIFRLDNFAAEASLTESECLYYGDTKDINQYCLMQLFVLLNRLNSFYRDKLIEYFETQSDSELMKIFIVFAQSITLYAEYNFNGVLPLNSAPIEEILMLGDRKIKFDFSKLSCEQRNEAMKLLQNGEFDKMERWAKTVKEEETILEKKDSCYVFGQYLGSTNEVKFIDLSKISSDRFMGSDYVETRWGVENCITCASPEIVNAPSYKK